MTTALLRSSSLFGVLMLVCLHLGCGRSETPEVMLERARILMQREQIAEAVPLLDAVVAAMPESAEARYQRGVAYERLNVLEKALADYTECLELDDERTDALNNKAVVLARLERLDEATKDFTRLIEMDPQGSLAWRNRALSYADQKQYDKSLADYGKALELAPEDHVNWYQRGVVYLAQGKLTEAESDFSKAIELDPELARAWMNRGVVRYRQGKKQLASVDLQKAQELDDAIVLPDVGFFSAQTSADHPTWTEIRSFAEAELSQNGFRDLVLVSEQPTALCGVFRGLRRDQTAVIAVGFVGAEESTIIVPDLDGLAEDARQAESFAVLAVSHAADGQTMRVRAMIDPWNPAAEVKRRLLQIPIELAP
jgi:tetratricopeptide (TPR) repeat protein